MTKKTTAKQNRAGLAQRSIALLLCALMLVMTAGCAQMSEAEKRVEKELDALKTSESVGSEVSGLKKSLSEEGAKNFDTFITKLRDFDYEIIGTAEGDDCTIVTVRIRTYDFGREYLAVWTDYLKEHDDLLSEDDDLTDFYEQLFARLAGLEKKEYIRDVEITCVDPLGSGEWIADIKDNEQLQDAVFGGMMSEMKALAEE